MEPNAPLPIPPTPSPVQPPVPTPNPELNSVPVPPPSTFPTAPPPNKSSKIKLIVGAIIGIVVVLLVLSLASNKSSTTGSREIKGLVISRENYVANCSDEATKNSQITNKKANDYCGCVYDKGVAKYGGESFTQKNIDIEKTGTLTPELNDLVNECVPLVR